MDTIYKPIVVDTCAIMSDSSILENLINMGYSIIINIVTVEELDSLKTNHDYCKAKQARHAIRAIEKFKNNIRFDIERSVDELLISESPNVYNINDDIITTCAKRNHSMLVTNDLNLKVKSKIIGVDILDYNLHQNNYLGYKIVNANDNEIASVYEKPNENIFQNLTNEYVVIKDGKKFIRAEALDQEEEKEAQEETKTASKSAEDREKRQDSTSSDKDEIIRILKENIEDLKKDKEFIQEQLEGKNKQIETLTGSLQGMQLLLVANTREKNDQEQEPQVIYTAGNQDKEEAQVEAKKSTLSRFKNWLKH